MPEIDNLPDFHGDPEGARLVLYVGGNYFFAMAPLVDAFEQMHPEYKGKLFWETLPPGILAEQIKAGGTITVGNMTWTIKPDVYLAGLGDVNSLIASDHLAGPPSIFAVNDLTIMVPKGNPAGIRGLTDLARPEVRLAMPNPQFEGVAKQIQQALTKAGGKALETAIYATKVQQGSTILTQIHHRQTPLFLMQGKVDAGVTWQSEARFQQQVGNSIEQVAIPPDQNVSGTYAGAMVKSARHPDAARAWLKFIMSPKASSLLATFGFQAPPAAASASPTGSALAKAQGR
ncbi:substrate-binding domain-containing protein [Sphingomonas sp. BN140010]|uniref:Substrate-binding domain-containing protein n=1 Tax=Sphingomonas arvum TaxID=2992113 RepID=A0ABT3JDP9_9SPHN|nr:substrate-binding domain-containing protein [Sphingomonas sp. BN140010]MCW3797197.1 substrate-binding domain-containing protein [Sphingomonas sp. BN140010]